MVAVSRSTFQSLAERGVELHLDDLPPDVEIALTQEGLDVDALALAAGGDRIVTGREELGALYDEITRTSGAPSERQRASDLERAQRIYRALEKLAADPKIPEMQTHLPMAGLRSEIQGRPLSEAFASKDWDQVVVSTSMSMPRWLPAQARIDALAPLEDGSHLFRYSDPEGRDTLMWIDQREEARKVDAFRLLPEDPAFYRARTNDPDASRRLADAAKQWNRDMIHLVEEKGMAPEEARRFVRQVDDEVFRQVLGAAAMAYAAPALGSRPSFGTARRSRVPRDLDPPAPFSKPKPKTTKALATQTIGSGDRAMTATSKQLQKKQQAHGADFGVPGNFNKKTEGEFAKAIEAHVDHPETRMIPGTYKQNIPVTHFYNPKTNLNVMRSENGEFLSGWKLNEKQAMNVATRGSL